MIRRSTLIAAEIVAALVAAALIALGVAWWRLSQGPVELAFIAQHVQAELSEARSGRPVGIERVELAWSREANALELRAVGVTIEDGRGRVLSRSDEARIELGALPLLMGRVSVTRAEFSGGEISITRMADGAVHVAFGPVGSPPDIIVPPPPLHETLEERVARVLDGMAEAFAPVGPGARLVSVGARNVHLAVVDEKGGGRWSANAARIALARQGQALTLTAEARLEAAQERTAQSQAPATFRVTTDTAFQSAIIEFGAENVRPRALLSEAALGPFRGLDAPLTAQISIGLDRKVGVSMIEGHADLGEGVAMVAGERWQIDGGSARGRYDIESDELIIDEVSLAGAETRLNGELRLRDASALLRAAPDAPAAFNVSLPSMTLDVPGVFSAPIDLSGVEASGVIEIASRNVRFSRIVARSGEANAEISGRVYWAEAGVGENRRVHPGVEFAGSVSGVLQSRAVLDLWPIGVGESARQYLARALTAGEIHNARVKLDIRPSDFAADQWRNEAVDVRFDYTGATFKFLTTMSAIEDARGAAVLGGNRFDLTMETGTLNGLALTRGRVEIPRFKPRGALATYSARAEGDARRVVEVLLQEPLSLGERLPVVPETVTGRAVVDLRFQRPNQSDVPAEALLYTIDGRLEDVSATLRDKSIALSRGRLAVRGDQRAVTVSGPVRAGESDVNVQWTERQVQQGPSSEYQISGDFDARDLVRLGHSVASYAHGRVGVVVSGEGNGFSDIDDANVQVDLRNAAVETPFKFWTKRAGAPASVSFDVSQAANGVMILSNLNGRGAGLVVQGEVQVGRDERIASADLTRLAIEGRSDARLRASRNAAGAYLIQIEGDLFDAQPFMDNPAQPGARGANSSVEPPLHADIDVARLKLRGDATLSRADVSVDIVNEALTRLSAQGRAPQGGALSLEIGPRAGDPRSRVVMSSDDAGFAMRALTGSENVVGGTATAEGVWRPGPPTSADFSVRLRDFQVVRLPAMTRLLSSAGSLTGLVEMLNGDGIGFTNLDASLVYRDDAIRIVEARAAGPSLGLTATGAYAIKTDNFDVDGVVVPSYGLNSMLGAVPILGDLFVSRRGEGVFGMTYSINGPAEEPRVGVNPLSALTPGILRRIFEPVQSLDRPRETAALPGSEGAAPAN